MAVFTMRLLCIFMIYSAVAPMLGGISHRINHSLCPSLCTLIYLPYPAVPLSCQEPLSHVVPLLGGHADHGLVRGGGVCVGLNHLGTFRKTVE